MNAIDPAKTPIDVVIPALNEERSIGQVVRSVPDWVRRIVVVDNGSTDDTAKVAREAGASVVSEPRRGYGAACLCGLAALDHPQIVVFVDADRSDRPEEMIDLVSPILEGRAAMVIGSRTLGHAEPGSLTPPQRFGNLLSSFLIRQIWRIDCTDLGPFRAIRYDALRQLRMDDLDYGWTVQMQARAARQKLPVLEVPVSYHKRIGVSKISGTVRGVVGAGTKILSTIAREALAGPPPPPRKTLIVFTRLPVPGRTKTRLIPTLGEDGAAELQDQMTRHTLDIARRWRRQAGQHAAIEVRFTGGSAEDMREHFGADFDYQDQGTGSLGQRMHRACTDTLRSQNDHVVIIGSDCPELTPLTLHRAFSALACSADLTLGPARDGGYYLIGMNRPQPNMFHRIDWGTARVLAQSLDAGRAAGLRIALLDERDDVDEAEDLALWERIRQDIDARGPAPLLSVIVPTLDEADHLAACLHSIQPTRSEDSDLEIIIADGGSSDETVSIAEQFNAQVIHTQCGRAAQMNAGAARARGELLLFLHADTRLPFGYRDEVVRLISRADVAGGAFRFALDSVSPALRQIERGTNLRSRWGGLPYGDQALFLQRDRFETLGGYPDWPVLEDFELIRRLKKHGRIALANTHIITSARRYQLRGPLRTVLEHQMILSRFLCGQSPAQLAHRVT
ncbi:MAG: DUF2064 domain-containing protein [Phycisphaerales bacterium]|nr:MAG: DUF2064 domain-containing protein [Phycisphaerales bacterium]